MFIIYGQLFREKKNAKPYWSEANKQGNDYHLDFCPELNNSLFLNKTTSQELKEINKEKKKISMNNDTNNTMKNITYHRMSNSDFNLNDSYDKKKFNKSLLTMIDINDNNLSKKHSNDIIELCMKVYNKLKINLTDVIKQFKVHQVKGKNGKISDHIFLKILREHGVVLSVYEVPKLTHSFRVFSMPGVTDFVEFLQVCQLSK